MTKKIVYANARVFLMQRLVYGRDGKSDIVCSSDCHYQSFSCFVSLFESHENIIVEFLFCYLSKWEWKKYMCGTLPFSHSLLFKLTNHDDFRCWETRKCEKGQF